MKRIAIPIETEELCSYGCNCIAKFKNASGSLMCNDRASKCPKVREKNSSAIKQAHSTGKIPGWKQHEKNGVTFNRGWSKDRILNVDFSLNGKGNHKGALIKERGHRCECCNNSEWQNMPITLELEHIDGNNKNNVRDNLKLLCPNCHSQTPTWRGRNINASKIVNDDVLLEALITSPSIRQALIKVGLTPKGGNYVRAKRLIATLC